MGGEDDQERIVQEIEVLPHERMHNTEPVLENETHKILWDFEILRDHSISARRPD